MKTWNGPTPYDKEKPFPHSSFHNERRAYVAAMNSPEVQALYETLKWAKGFIMDEWEGTEAEERMRQKLDASLTAYEAGLKETP